MNKLPRKSLRESAFHRWEPFIARGCKESFLIDPTLHNCKPASFITGFTEAKLGFKRYGYASTLIPPGYDVDRVQAFETDNAMVLIENSYEEHQKKIALANVSHGSVVMENGQVSKINSKEKPKEQTIIRDNDTLIKVCDALAANAISGFTTLILVAPTVDLFEIKQKWPTVEVEELNEGFSRLC